MSEIDEAVKESLNESPDHHLNRFIAAFVAVTATFMALVSIKGGKTVQQMAESQAHAVDSWNYYQAKSIKQMTSETVSEQLATHVLVTPGITPATRAAIEERIAHYSEQAKRHEQEKEAIKKQAEGFEEDYHHKHIKHDQLEFSEAFLTIAIAVAGITVLTRRRWLLGVSNVMMAAGVIFGLAAFLNWSIHPEILMRWLD
jgi:hypothetical protein